MRVFVDTSSLIKKYIAESGSREIFELLKNTTNLIVSPTTRLELLNTLKRKLREKRITTVDYKKLLKEINSDYEAFEIVQWDVSLEAKCEELIEKIDLNSLDTLQLASALIVKVDCFATSDVNLYKNAKKKIKKSVLI